MFKKVSFFCIVLLAFFLGAESFLVPEKNERKKSAQQIKQEIVDLMAHLVEKKSKIIEKEAQIQQVFCRKIRAFAQSDKENFLPKASYKDLQNLEAQLKEELQRTEQYQVGLSKYQTHFTSYWVK